MTRLLLFVLAVSYSGSAMSQSPIGFRTDGTGRYPDANPPLHWATDKNVVWHIELPKSNAIPVILGEKLFTCAEPCVLLCIDKSNGKILWEAESRFDEIKLSETEQAQFEVERRQAEQLDKQLSVLNKQRSELQKLLKDGKTTKEEADEKFKELRTQSDAIREEKRKLTTWNRYLEAGKGGAGRYHPTGGYSSPTPVTDGKHVYVIFGNGLAACYDLEGNRQWLKLVEQPTAAYGHGSSPLLVGDKLLVHFSDLVALDTRDGREAWRAKVSPGHGTAMHTRLGDVDVAIHPSGNVYRISDGTLLAKGLGKTGPNSPLVQEGKVFFVAGRVSGYALPTSSEIPATWEPLWKGPNLKGGGYWFPSPILHDGLIYAMNARSIFSVVDATTGELVYERRLDFGGGQSYPSITLAGNFLFASSDNGTTLVLEPGREYKELARNSLEPFRSSLVFEGNRMYARTTKGLWCIGQ
ncbi:MAG: PQQ-binding-like beta-propeller repeat protein [Planctomycetaceae bacterium]|nr:PQQ-binding-like beta-propeller repeat protein [Planctomycetaceae bacterium]